MHHSLLNYLLLLTGSHFPQLDLNNDLEIREPSVHTQARTWVTDYLVGCHASEESGLSVFVGSNECVSLSSFHSPSSVPFQSHAPLSKGRHRAAKERRLPRPCVALVFGAGVDGPSQGRRAISAPG